MTVKKDSPLRWHKAADRANERERKAAPLFAWGGLVPVHTAQSVRDLQERRWQEFEANMAAMDAESRYHAALLRSGVASLVSEEELSALEAYRQKTFPRVPTYDVTFWHGQARKRGLFYSWDLSLMESPEWVAWSRCDRCGFFLRLYEGLCWDCGQPWRRRCS